MQSIQQLPALSAEEGAGRCTMEATRGAENKEVNSKDVTHHLGNSYTPPPPPMPREEWEARQQKRSSATVPLGSFLRPLPTIETMMAYPGLTRPTYDSIARGEPPAQTYNTVIHTPKPPNLRPTYSSAKSPLDQIMARAAELENESASGVRLRSDTNSSIGSLMTARSYDSEGSIDYDGESKDDGLFHMEITDAGPPSPSLSVSSTCCATVSSSPPRSPLSPAYPTTQVNQDNVSGRSSPTGSFRSSLSTLSSLYGTYSSNSSKNSSRTSSPAHSPPSSASPSRPASPEFPGESEGWVVYISPSSAQEVKEHEVEASRRRSQSFPSPPQLQADPSSPSTSQHKATPPQPLRLRASSLPLLSSSSSSSSSSQLQNDSPSPLSLSTFPPFSPLDPPSSTFSSSSSSPSEEEDNMDWSMNGGIIYGSAGVALSPRAMRSTCCHCECRGLGLYVIEEEPEDGSIVQSIEVGEGMQM